MHSSIVDTLPLSVKFPAPRPPTRSLFLKTLPSLQFNLGLDGVVAGVRVVEGGVVVVDLEVGLVVGLVVVGGFVVGVVVDGVVVGAVVVSFFGVVDECVFFLLVGL